MELLLGQAAGMELLEYLLHSSLLSKNTIFSAFIVFIPSGLPSKLFYFCVIHPYHQSYLISNMICSVVIVIILNGLRTPTWTESESIRAKYCLRRVTAGSRDL